MLTTILPTTSRDKYYGYIETKNKKLDVIIEGHGKIFMQPKNMEGLFGYGTHTCSLICVEGVHGEIGMVHIHERIGVSDLSEYCKHINGIKKITSIGGSDTTKDLIQNTIGYGNMHCNYEHIGGQYDASIYNKNGEIKIDIGKHSDELIQNKLKNLNQHISSWAYINFVIGVKAKEKNNPLIVEVS